MGKDSPIEFVSELINQDKELKEKILNLMSTILIFKVDCKNLLSLAIDEAISSTNKSLEDHFIHHLIAQTIYMLRKRTKLPKYVEDQLRTFYSQSYNQLRNNGQHYSDQVSIHIKLMKLIMNIINDGTITKLQVDHNSEGVKKKPKMSTNKIKRIIIIIDEANIFESQRITSKFMGRNKECSNFFVTLFDKAMMSDPDRIKGRAINFVFASVVPIYKNKTSRGDVWEIGSFKHVLKQVNYVSFGELKLEKFREMAMSSGENNNTRRLYELYTKCKTTKLAIGEYLSTDMEPNFMSVIKEHWVNIFPDRLYTNGNIPNDDDILKNLYFFFMTIFGQPLYKFKNKLTVAMFILKRNARINKGYLKFSGKDKHEDGKVKRNIPDTKLNCDMMMNLIAEDSGKNKINEDCVGLGSEDIHLREFLKCFITFKERHSIDGFPHHVTTKTLGLLNQGRDRVPHDYYHQTLYLGCHLGLVKLRLNLSKNQDGDEIKQYYFTWMTNIIQKRIMKQYEEYKRRVSTIYEYTYEDKDKLLFAIDNFAFFKSKVMREVIKRTEIHFMNIEIDDCDEGDVRDKMKEKLKEVIKEKVKSICNYHDEEGLDDFINITHECPMNKRYPEAQTRKTAKLDLNVILRMGNDSGSRLRVIFELNKDVGKIYNHSIMKEVKKTIILWIFWIMNLILYMYQHR